VGLPGRPARGWQPCSGRLCSSHALAPHSCPAVATARRKTLPWRSRRRCAWCAVAGAAGRVRAGRVRAGRQQDAAQDGAQLAARGAGWQGRMRTLRAALPAPWGVRPLRDLARRRAARGVRGGGGEPGVQGCQARQPLGRLIRRLPKHTHVAGQERSAWRADSAPGSNSMFACRHGMITLAFLGKAGQHGSKGYARRNKVFEDCRLTRRAR